MQGSLAQLRMLQLASASLPVGGYTYSQGLEWAVEAGWVRTVADFVRWQTEQIHDTLVSLDWPVLSRLYAAADLQQSELGASTRGPTGERLNCGPKRPSGAQPWPA